MKAMNEYEKEAEEFLDKVGAKMEVDYCGYMKHFHDDKEKRNVWDVTFTRGNRLMTVRFGQSINDSIDKRSSWGPTIKKNPPTAYDVLSCLTKDDPGDIDEFTSEYGYTEGKVSEAIKTYNAVCKEYGDVCRVFGDVMDELREIQ